MSEADEFMAAVGGLEESYKQGLKAFAEWFAREWQTSKEEWVAAYADPLPEDEWIAGHNTGVKSVLIALDCFLNEHMA